jgi:cobalt-zinc-cadmium resistance protein CzcA
MYRVLGDGFSLAELRAVQDWVIRPRLRTVAGVADVNSLGGEVRAFEVIPNPDRLAALGLDLGDIERAVAENNRNAGGDRINRDNGILLVRTLGQVGNQGDIAKIVVTTRAGAPVLVGDVAEVRLGSLTRYGAVTANGEGETATGLVLLRKGGNSRSTVDGVKRELDALKASLPAGVTIEPFYDRTDLINAAVWTVEKALGEAVVLVVLVLIVMLGNLRAALTTALILPLSVLVTFLVMRVFGQTANLMSFGGLAIAIGVLVDAAVVVVENIHSQLAHAPRGVDRLHLVYRATREVAAPVIAGVLIIIAVLLPLFSLTGLEGKMFTPLAITIAIALVVSLVLSLTVIPVLASLLMRGGAHDEGRLLPALQRIYRPLVDWALKHRRVAVGGALALLAGAVALFTLIGAEFLPVMDEGTTVIIIEKDSNISLEHSLALDAPIQKSFMDLPEVAAVVSRTGADELRLDPMGLYQTDNFLVTKPRSEWTASLKDFERRLREKLDQFKELELDVAFTQPIDMRASEMLTGARAALAIKLHGDDLDVLDSTARQIEEVVNRVPGATDVFRGRLSGQRYMEFTLRRDRLARYGISAESVNTLIETAVGGKVVSEVVEGSRRSPVLLRAPESARASAQTIARLLVATEGGARVPIGELATIREADGPVLIQREGARRQVTVQANVEGRDIVGFVNDVRAAIARDVPLPRGYTVSYGGQFENQQRASARLMLVVPVSIVLIFLMLFTTFGSMSQAALVLLNVPFALIGGVVSLYISGLYMSVPASVGFITLFGVAVLNGVVMVSYFNQLRSSGRPVLDAVREGAARRLRPVLMTALIASLGLVPMLLATGPGSELQRPLAIVVIGGLVTSTLLTLILLPSLYAWLEGRAERRLKPENGVLS